MLLEAPKPTAAQLAKIEKLEAEAKRALEREEESFQRCDTDGFLSQWAHGMTASLNREKIRILQNGGYAQFSVLVHTATGEVVADTNYSFPNKFAPWNLDYKWKSLNLEKTAGRKWVPQGSRSRWQKQNGLHEELRWFPAYAKIGVADGAKSTGLAGCANAFVRVYRGKED